MTPSVPIIREIAPRRVLFFGDSLVAGVGDPAGGGWVARVVSACFDQGQPVTAYNLGIRRETSIQVAARWRTEARARVPSGAGARVVISLGANDTTIDEGTVRVSPDRSRRALAAILDEVSAVGMSSFVVGPAPVDDAEQNARIKALTESFAKVSIERGVPFVGVAEALLKSSAWMAEVAAGDGAHPAAEGYRTVAQRLIDAGLLAWLTEADP
jgi:lysophospholipase L1-like esterase